jgi:hypothetical protein
MPSLVQDRETQKKAIGEFLKSADRFIKSSEFPKALDEVKKALAIEANNMYALAYNERIKVAMEAGRKKEEEERVKKLAEEQKKSAASGPKTSDAPPRAQNAPDAKPQTVPAQPPPSPAAQVPGDDMLTKIRKEAQDTAEKKSDARIELLKQEFSTSQQRFQQDIAHLATQAKDAIAAKEEAEEKLAAMQSQPGKEGQRPPAGDAKEQMLGLLAKLFQKAWEDDVISPDERGLLTVLKNELGLSDQEFLKIENEKKSTAYLGHLREVWKDGLVTPEEAERLETLRKSLNISAEDHLRLEAQIRKELQEKK